MFLKCFKTIIQDTEKNMIEIMEKKWKIISGLLCNQKCKEAHTVVSLMIKETIILLTNTCQTVLL